jgi:hypothetical protein
MRLAYRKQYRQAAKAIRQDGLTRLLAHHDQAHAEQRIEDVKPQNLLQHCKEGCYQRHQCL